MSNEELTVLIQQGRAELLSDLWEQTKALLFRIMWRYVYEYDYKTRGYTLEDLEQECFIILCKAVASYKPDKEHKLSAYFKYIMLNHLNSIIGNRIKSVGLDILNEAESLNQTISDSDESLTLADIIEDKHNAYEEAESKILNEQLKESFETAFKRLDKVQREYIELYYYKGSTLAEIGKIMNVAPQKVRQTLAESYRALRKCKELTTYKELIISSKAYQGNGFNAFSHYGSAPERITELFDN